MRDDHRGSAAEVIALLVLLSPVWAADGPVRPLLVFMQPADALAPAGQLSFEANALVHRGALVRVADTAPASRPDQRDAARSLPPFIALLAVPQPDGSHVVFGSRADEADRPDRAEGRTFRWVLYRARTPDGYRITEFQEVGRNPEGPWLIEAAMARDERTGRVFFFPWSRHPEPAKGHALWAFFSDDGSDFRPLAKEPVYLGHDAFGLMWDARRQRLLCGQVVQQDWAKPFADNLGASRRRVLAIRTSADGVNWQEEAKAGPAGRIAPDADDPPELEFYRLQPFACADRYVAMADLYAASPLTPSRHGPHLGCQWWVSADGIHWDRPWRQVDAHGDAPYPAKMTPMWVGREMLFWIGGQVWGLPEYRIASIGAAANARFTTRPFTMPDRPLLLNASVPRGHGVFDQAVVQVELCDEAGRGLAGYEGGQCELRGVDDTRIPLRWGARDGTEHAGRRVSLRFHLRAARLYALGF